MMRQGFTFVELMIVAVVVAMLMAIAVPNFLEAQTRARVSAERGNLATLAHAIEAYRLDWRRYPANANPATPAQSDLFVLTTPVAYVTSIPNAFFPPTSPTDPPYKYYHLAASYDPDDNPWIHPISRAIQQFLIMTPGPDRGYEFAGAQPSSLIVYDPTNGTVSKGDIETSGP